MKGCPTSYEGLINEEEIECPNCGEFIVVVIDKSIDIQEYIEKRIIIEIEKIRTGTNKEVEKRYVRYRDYG